MDGKKSKRLGRRVAVGIVSFVLAGALGAFAAWIVYVIPQGNGTAVGQGATTNTVQGVAITTDFGNANGAGSVGPNDTGQVKLYARNTNAFDVTLTNVAQGPGSVIAVDSSGNPSTPTCTAPQASLTLTSWSGSVTIPANSGVQLTPNLTVTTTSAFPRCLSDKLFTVPVTLDGSAA